MTTTKMLGMVALFAGALLNQGCGGFLGCGAPDEETAEASLYVVDTDTGEAVARPTFFDGGLERSASCQGEQTAAGACDAYLLFLSRDLVHTVVVSAPGYAPATLSVDLEQNLSIHLAVELHRR